MRVAVLGGRRELSRDCLLLCELELYLREVLLPRCFLVLVFGSELAQGLVPGSGHFGPEFLLPQLALPSSCGGDLIRVVAVHLSQALLCSKP